MTIHSDSGTRNELSRNLIFSPYKLTLVNFYSFFNTLIHDTLLLLYYTTIALL